ncbi:MAG: septal ring lytic transglycosylase RlpA family protein [Chitinophagaceae bacterium]|nr:septal ring lytic transglycosylase RlpA family protein [Chitinophagaceae bacterium]
MQGKSIIIGSGFLPRLVYIIAFSIFLFFQVDTFTQNPKPANKIKPGKTTRVFYGQASFYSNKFEGRRTASGETFSQKKLTCACNVLPLGTWIKVTNLRNRKTVIVKVNDRIHPKMKRVVDLSKAAALRLGYVSKGLTRVKVELIDKKLVPQY